MILLKAYCRITLCALLCRYKCQHAPSTTPQTHSIHIFTDSFTTNFNNLTINIDRFRSKTQNAMAQNPSHLYIPDRQFVVLQDGRRIWSTGEVEYPDGYIGYVGSAGIVPPADGSHGTFYDPFRRFFIIVSDSGYTSTQESRQEAGSSVPANQSEINGESRLGNRTTTTIGQPPPNSDPSAGFYRAYVKFMDGKKVSEAKLREHLETFGPIGPYLRPSPKTKKNVSCRSILRLTAALANLFPFHV